MRKALDFNDLQILECLAIHGPRNINYVARKLGIPNETLRKRLKRLQSQIFLRTHVNIFHTNLGLKKAVVFAEAIPGYEDLLFECLKINDYWLFVARYYGMNEGCIGIYTIPKEYDVKFEQFLEELRRIGPAVNIRLFWSTCFQAVHSRAKWFDPATKTWNFRWDEWVGEISTKKAQLPYTLIDPQDFPVKADKIDVLILKELEKDATIKLSKLAKMLGISAQLVGYHFQKHLLQRGLIESFEVDAYYFDRSDSERLFFIFTFDSTKKLAKFASSLLDKPFVRTLGKILGENSLYAYIYIPRTEFRKLIETLSEIIKKDLLQSYRYAIQDPQKASRQTISYEYFKNGKWIYNHKKHVTDLQNLVKSAKTDRTYLTEKYA
jgi:DNA-binding Lrp family transcriptional regulator